MAAQGRRCFVPQLEECFEEPGIDVTILEVFQKLGYDSLTQDQAQTARSFVLSFVYQLGTANHSVMLLCRTFMTVLWRFAGLFGSTTKDVSHCSLWLFLWTMLATRVTDSTTLLLALPARTLDTWSEISAT